MNNTNIAFFSWAKAGMPRQEHNFIFVLIVYHTKFYGILKFKEKNQSWAETKKYDSTLDKVILM